MDIHGGRSEPIVTGRLRVGARLRAYFLAGVLVTAPISITLYLAYLFISVIDDWVTALLPPRFNPETYLPFSVPGIGLLVMLVALTVIGALTAGFLGRLFLRVSERILARIPAVRSIYSAVKQILETVLAQQSSAFREVVLIEYPRRGIWVIGFITGATEGEVQNLTEDTLINIFVPTTPNPTSGFLLFLPKRDVVTLDMTVEEGIKMVVSAGIVTPPDRREPEEQHQRRIASRADGADVAIEAGAERTAKRDRPTRGRRTG
ncbi:MAG: DUF502 domain-containing protein [Alphaproteobacteria bacterium]